MTVAWLFASVLYSDRRPTWHLPENAASPVFPRMMCGRRGQRFNLGMPRYAIPLQLRHADVIGQPCRTCLRVDGKLS